ncbi:hypothetical protein [Lysobacter capsici]|uniref:hypothetical protein n=1 Tax=Lysobacter capsici TaxID=435897 RepID=UPI000BBACA1D|nr:hypothetical protein [Lysobacter capsici]ATE74209.1 hypothetical protein CNO08_24320 [Lysobacter capsici]
MNFETPNPSTPPPVDPRLAGRHRGARICAIACLVLVLLLAAASVVFIGTDRFGCWGGAYLFLASLLALGIPSLILLLVTAWLRAYELLWLGAAIGLSYFAVEVITSLLPPVLCSGSG